MPYGLITLFDNAVAAEIESHSRILGESQGSVMTLDSLRPPHMSILHIDCDRKSALRLWEIVKPLVPAVIPTYMASLTIRAIKAPDFYVPEGGFDFAIEVTKTSVITRIHSIALESSTELGLPILGSVGDHFRPHITIAVTRRIDLDETGIPVRLLGTSYSSLLALGELGAFGSFPTVISSA